MASGNVTTHRGPHKPTYPGVVLSSPSVSSLYCGKIHQLCSEFVVSKSVLKVPCPSKRGPQTCVSGFSPGGKRRLWPPQTNAPEINGGSQSSHSASGDLDCDWSLAIHPNRSQLLLEPAG